MKPTVLAWINRVLLTALSIMTGVVKLARMEDEMVIFRTIGFPDPLTMAFGLVQVAGGVLLLMPRTTRWGAAVMVPTFVFATGVLFANGLVTFGVFSGLFIAMAMFHARRWPRPPSDPPTG